VRPSARTPDSAARNDRLTVGSGIDRVSGVTDTPPPAPKPKVDYTPPPPKRESKVWFTSDSHYGHARVIQYSNRPFKDIEEMDWAMVERWNAVVESHDRVYHLGDFSFRKPEISAKIASMLNGQKFLIEGNHDHSQNIKAIAPHFVWVKEYFELSIADADVNGGKQKIILAHYPFLTWNKSHHGSWHLHGHCHGTLRPDVGARRLDVGVDCHNYTPIDYARVKELMSAKTFIPVDHHTGRED